MAEMPFNEIRVRLITLTEDLGYHRWNGNLRSRFRWLRDMKKVRLVQKVLQKVVSGDTVKVLDLGCGFGHLTIIMKKIGFDAIGADIQRKNFKVSRKLAATFVLCDGLALPFSSSAFGFILVNGVLEHVGGLLQERTLLWECSRVLRKNGVLFVSALPRKYRLEHMMSKLNIPSHRRYFDAKTLRELVNATGFDIIELGRGQLIINNILPFRFSDHLPFVLNALEDVQTKILDFLYETWEIVAQKR